MGVGYESVLSPATVLNQAAGSPLSNSTTLTDISPAPQIVVPANAMFPGATMKITARCKFSNVTAAPSILLGFYWGGVAGTKICAIGATATTLTAANWPIHVEGYVVCNSIGSSGTVTGFGFVDLGTSLTAVTRIPMDAAAIAAVSVDTTTAKAITLGAQWSGGSSPSSSDTITCVQYIVEALNF